MHPTLVVVLLHFGSFFNHSNSNADTNGVLELTKSISQKCKESFHILKSVENSETEENNSK